MVCQKKDEEGGFKGGMMMDDVTVRGQRGSARVSWKASLSRFLPALRHLSLPEKLGLGPSVENQLCNLSIASILACHYV